MVMLVIFHALNENEGNLILKDEKNQQLTFGLEFYFQKGFCNKVLAKYKRQM